MRPAAEISRVLELGEIGLGASAIARTTGLPRATVRDWLAGRTPRRNSRVAESCARCGAPEHDFTSLPASYPYLLGLYLGDGCISIHARGVARLRVFLDLKYPMIIEECKRAIFDLLPDNRIHAQARGSNYTGSEEPTNVTISAYSKSWTCFIPQHGPGRKHERPIVLEPWQWMLIEKSPGLLLRGLIHSDGCRFINTGTNWRYARYSFSNRSEDIRGIFERSCRLLGLHCTHAPHTVYVSRKDDVDLLDQHIGPKR